MYAWTIDILLSGSLLVFHLALLAMSEYPVDFGDKAEHEQPFPAKMRCRINTCMSEGLMGSFNDPMPQCMRDVEAVTGDSIIRYLKAPQLRGRVLLEGRKEGKQPLLVWRQQPFLGLGGGKIFPLANITQVVISASVVL